MKRLIIILVLLLCAVSYGVPRDAARAERGEFTGPRSGNSQDANIKAALAFISAGSDVLTTGKIWYVDSGEGTGTENGFGWLTAYDTINEAIDASSADGGSGRGDYIVAAPGHNEGGTISAIFDADLIGLTIVGFGRGNQMPTLDFDGASATCAVGADGVKIKNIRFRISVNNTNVNNVPTIALTIDDGADYTVIDGCEFGYAETAGTDEFGYAIQIGAATGTVIKNSFFDAGEAGSVAAISMNGSDLTTIIGSKITGDYSVSNIYAATTTNTHILIDGNILWNGVHSGLNAQPVIQMNAEDTGISTRNKAACNVATVAAAFVGAKLLNFGNWYNEDVGGAATAFNLDTASQTTVTVTASGDG